MKIYTSDDLQIISDVLGTIRKRPNTYAGEKPWGPKLAAGLSHDLVYLRALPVTVDNLEGWWIVSSVKDWLVNAQGEVSLEPFAKFFPDPSLMANSMRTEVIIAALASGVVTFGRDGIKWITGNSAQVALPDQVKKKISGEGSGRAVAFTIDGEAG